LKKSITSSQGLPALFSKDVPESAAARRDYARELVGSFAGKAFRRPATEK